MSLCFLKALSKVKLAERGITEHEYHQHLLAHFRGVRHSEDSIPSVGDTLQALEPWAGSLREIALTSQYNALQSTSSCEELFSACLEGNLDSFKQSFQALHGEGLQGQGYPNLLQPSACLAAQKQHHKLLKFCLDQGAVFDRYLSRAAQLGAYSTEMLELLLAANWSDIQHSAEAVRQQIIHFGDDSFPAQWLKENAAKETFKNISEDATMESTKRARSSWKRKRIKRQSKGRDPTKGTGSRDPKQGPSPEQIQKWFGDVP